MSFDLVIKNGEVLDGSGAAAQRKDIAVKDGKIVALGDLEQAQAEQVIDAQGRVVTPGFIDAHGHSDVSLHMNPVCETRIAQGITTEVMGNCGYSPFPMFDNNRGYFIVPENLVLPWSTPDDYYETISGNGMGINAMPQIGHITTRAAVLNRVDRPARPDEIDRMKDFIREAMAYGTRGLSTGLEYSPTTASDLEEIVELCQVVTEYGGIYTSHIRGYGRNLLNAVAEAIEIGRRTGVRVEISHLLTAGRAQWGYAERVLYLMEQARREGIQVACDMLVYPTAGAWWSPRAVFPDWAYDWRKPWDENLPELRRMLRVPDSRQRLRDAVEHNRTRPKHGFDEMMIFGNWDDIVIEELPSASPREKLLGMTMASAAEHEGLEPVDLYFDLIDKEGEHFAAVHSTVGRDDFAQLMADDHTMFGTDAIGTTFARLHESWNALQPHPRHFGTFPHVIETFVGKQRALELSEAVRRMTSLPADHFQLHNRGLIRPGYAADIVIFDLNKVEDRGTWRLPVAYPGGINDVFVNGTQALANGEFTGQLGGHMLVKSTA
jgi:N-acyl-D-aspartate/D-glutamate deacylase